MTASIEKLIVEQKEKQRMENELAIAQEVQAQLFPRNFATGVARSVRLLPSRAHGERGLLRFPHRNSDRLILAAGDVSGKGISAALLMATIHSAVERTAWKACPALRSVRGGRRAARECCWLLRPKGAKYRRAPCFRCSIISFTESTPTGKIRDPVSGQLRRPPAELTYSNGGHLPPIIIGRRRLAAPAGTGGTVVGLFDNLTFEEGVGAAQPGDIFIAYSDGITEPENDFGEFGEQRLMDAGPGEPRAAPGRNHRVVTSAVDDWIGDNEQPDDITTGAGPRTLSETSIHHLLTRVSEARCRAPRRRR